jgi:hypothetical protein
MPKTIHELVRVLYSCLIGGLIGCVALTVVGILPPREAFTLFAGQVVLAVSVCATVVGMKKIKRA